MNWSSKAIYSILAVMHGLSLVMVINFVASTAFVRLDFTEEQRYTIQQSTKELLRQLENDVYIEVFLDGDLNAGFRKFRRSVRDMLEEFRTLSKHRVHYTFINPHQASSRKERTLFMKELMSKGLSPINVVDNKRGVQSGSIVFPGALISYNGMEKGVMLLNGSRVLGSEQAFNQSVENLEYTLTSTIYSLTNENRRKIGLLTGHGEVQGAKLVALMEVLRQQYDVFNISLKDNRQLGRYDMIMIIKPQDAYSEQEKYFLDQYVMGGGNLLLLVDVMAVDRDSLSKHNVYYAFQNSFNLHDMLFQYGLRVNINLIKDKVSMRYPIVTGEAQGKPQTHAMPWPFSPLIVHYADHIITKNIDAVPLHFVSSIDTVQASGILKTPLMYTSLYVQQVRPPVEINVNALRDSRWAEIPQSEPLSVAYLLEGSFTSLYKNRLLPAGSEQSKFVDHGANSQIIVVADGDLALNAINLETGKAQPLGYDPLSTHTFANEHLLLNMVVYLTEENGLITARNKDFRIRILKKNKAREERVFWQFVNVLFPLLLLFLYGVIRFYIRRKKYAVQ